MLLLSRMKTSSYLLWKENVILTLPLSLERIFPPYFIELTFNANKSNKSGTGQHVAYSFFLSNVERLHFCTKRDCLFCIYYYVLRNCKAKLMKLRYFFLVQRRKTY